jgi:hypothetical protein
MGKGILRNKDYYGEPYELPDFFNDLAGPIGPMDIITAWRDYDAAEGAKALPGLIGVGIQAEHVRRDEFGRPTGRGNRSHNRRRQYSF